MIHKTQTTNKQHKNMQTTNYKLQATNSSQQHASLLVADCLLLMFKAQAQTSKRAIQLSNTKG
jgi:hypothetical protein